MMKLNFFNFKAFGRKMLLTNDFGNHMFLSVDDFQSIVSGNFALEESVLQSLMEHRMIYDDTDLTFSGKQKYEMRHSKKQVMLATSLHIFVVTTACNMNCVYCQANNGNNTAPLYMTKEIGEKAVDIALQSPIQNLSFEFQGGEPLLNFDVVKHIVQYTEEHKGSRDISYQIVTNLTLLTEEIIDFFLQYHMGVSTSLDGPPCVHNYNRPFLGGQETFPAVTQAIRKLQDKGLRVGAIQTTTKAALNYANEIVQTYCDLGFDSIFIRPLTPLGKAAMYWDNVGYTPQEFLTFYAKVLDAVLEQNRSGRFMKEDHTAILFQRMEGYFVNYMELRSPCGAAIGQLAYYADGNIFTCDEARMLFEMGNDAFRLGDVFSNTYRTLLCNDVCKAVCASSILESIPTCCDCVYQPYCGTCPVVNYAKTQDIVEKSPRGYRCQIYGGMLDYLFQKFYQCENETLEILRTWSN